MKKKTSTLQKKWLCLTFFYYTSITFFKNSIIYLSPHNNPLPPIMAYIPLLPQYTVIYIYYDPLPLPRYDIYDLLRITSFSLSSTFFFFFFLWIEWLLCVLGRFSRCYYFCLYRQSTLIVPIMNKALVFALVVASVAALAFGLS